MNPKVQPMRVRLLFEGDDVYHSLIARIIRVEVCGRSDDLQMPALRILDDY
jgi:hypothetical protein